MVYPGLFFMILAAPAAYGLPAPDDGLHFETPVTVWDEALPLGNGILGALVWGDGNPLKISLDRITASATSRMDFLESMLLLRIHL